MKKLMVGLLAAFLLATGLVALSGTQAQAACPYQGCIATKVAGNAKKVGRKLRVNGQVRAIGSSRTPQGTIKFTITGKRTIVRSVAAPNGGFTTKRLPRGKYTIKIRFIKKPNSAFKSSTAVTKTVRI